MIMKKGFAIIEVLVAVTILSIVLLTVIRGVSAGIVAISGNKNFSIAMIIARNKLNDFQLMQMRGADVQGEAVSEFPGFSFSRTTERFEHEWFGPLQAKSVKITVSWIEREVKRNYSLMYIFPSK
jgi:type II secretion system protein I